MFQLGTIQLINLIGLIGLLWLGITRGIEWLRIR